VATARSQSPNESYSHRVAFRGGIWRNFKIQFTKQKRRSRMAELYLRRDEKDHQEEQVKTIEKPVLTFNNPQFSRQ
jgi:hypothetical protein